MKTKAIIIGLALTGFVSGQLLAQVDTIPRKKDKTDTTWTDKRDTAWKDKRDTAHRRDTNQLSMSHYYRQSESNICEKHWVLVSHLLTQDIIAADNRWFVRRYRGEQRIPTL